MKRFALCLTLLMCISVTQAGYLGVYKFDGLPGADGSTLNTQADTVVTWKSSETGNTNLLKLGVSAVDATDKYAETVGNPTSERVVSTLNSGQVLFDISPTLTSLQISYRAYMNRTTPWLVGIWIDLDSSNTMPNNENEIVLQFGARTGTYGWRLRGANAGNPNYYANNWNGLGTDPAYVLLTVDVDLTGDGLADMTVTNMSDPVTYPAVKVFDDVALGLNTAGRETLRNPANWTGWTLRNQNSGATTTSKIDNLVIVPEPATLSLLVLGGLACLRRRR